MKGYHFESFQADDGNRTALEVCQAMATLEYAGPRPVVLRGPRGAGKSHLLWSIVHQVRGNAVKVGLGLVMAHEFPAAVRGLVNDPTPIQSGKPAILLVDELEQFRENAPDLELVVNLFLENGHLVVLASNQDLDQLDAFSAPFKAMLSAGCIIDITPRISAATENQPGMESLRAELDSVRNERDALSAQLRETAAKTEEALEEQSRLQTLLRTKEGIEAALKDARTECTAAQEALRETEAQWQALLHRVETQRMEMMASMNAMAGRVQLFADQFTHTNAALSDAERETLEAELTEARNLANAFREQRDVDHQQFEAHLAQLHAERDQIEELLEQARAEQGRLKVAIESARGRLDVLEPELDRARKTLAIQNAEMDALRNEAAAQVASANIRTGEMEHRVACLKSGWEAAQAMGRETENHLAAAGEDLARIVENLRALAARQTRLNHLVVEEPPQSNPEDQQAFLFDAVPDIDFIEVPRPEAFVQGFGSMAPETSGGGMSLRDVVEAALADPLPRPPAGDDLLESDPNGSIV